MGLQPKMIAVMCAVTALLMAIGTVAGFLYLTGAMRDLAGTELASLAQVAAISAGEVIGSNISLETASDNPKLKIFEDIKIGRNGTIAVVDDKGYIISCRGTRPFENKLCGYEELRKLLASKQGWVVIDGVYLHEGKTIAAFSKIESPALSMSGLSWYAVAAQEQEEILGGVAVFLSRMAAASLMLILITALAGFFLGAVFVRPVPALRGVLERIGSGDLDCRAAADSGDEFAELADSINAMTDDLKRTTTSIANLNKEIARSRKTGEEADRMRQLSADLIYGVSQARLMAAGKDAETAIRLISQLADIGEIEEGRFKPKAEIFDIKAVLKEVVFGLEPKIRGVGLDLRLSMPHDKCEVYADRASMVRVFNDLIENAARNTDKGHIDVLIKDVDAFIECSISDTGPGFSREDISRAFDRFRQTYGASKAKAGTGLELNLAKGMIEAQGGSIMVESALGRGTTFIFRLPKKK